MYAVPAAGRMPSTQNGKKAGACCETQQAPFAVFQVDEADVLSPIGGLFPPAFAPVIDLCAVEFCFCLIHLFVRFVKLRFDVTAAAPP